MAHPATFGTMNEEFADVAQLVEQLIRNQQVNGSSPFVGSILCDKYQGLREPVLRPRDAGSTF